MGLFSKKPQWKKDAEKRPLSRSEIEYVLRQYVISKIKSEKTLVFGNKKREWVYGSTTASFS